MVNILSDYILTEYERNRLDEARYALATASKESIISVDRVLYNLGLKCANSLAQAILALPGYTMTDDNTLVIDDTYIEDDHSGGFPPADPVDEDGSTFDGTGDGQGFTPPDGGESGDGDDDPLTPAEIAALLAGIAGGDPP